MTHIVTHQATHRVLYLLLSFQLSIPVIFSITMEHNLECYWDDLLNSKLPLYSASPGYTQDVSWCLETTGHVLVDKSSRADAVSSVVGRVIEQGLLSGPDSTFANQNYGSLQTAKFQFCVAKPVRTPFVDDFDKAIDNFMRIQGQVAATLNWCNFICEDSLSNKSLCFMCSVFTKRVGVTLWVQLRCECCVVSLWLIADWWS